MLLDSLTGLEVKNGVPYIVWCYWSGPKMSENRKKSFQYLIKNIGAPVYLITPQNLPSLVKPDFPLHPAFEYLSAVHKSDYIRAYILHHYGGAWHDVKATNVSFEKTWDLFVDKNIWMIGSPEIKNGAAPVYDTAGRYMLDYYKELISVPRWIGRAYTDLSLASLTGINKDLNENLETLAQHPAKHPREKYIAPKNKLHNMLIWAKQLASGRNPKYPLPWTLFGNSFHPAVLEFRKHVSRQLPVDTIKNAGIYHR